MNELFTWVRKKEMRTNRVRGCTHSVDPRQLLAHVHDDDGDQLPAEGALGQQAEHRQVSLGALRLLLQTHLRQLRLHVVPAAQPLQCCRGQTTPHGVIRVSPTFSESTGGVFVFPCLSLPSSRLLSG